MTSRPSTVIVVFEFSVSAVDVVCEDPSMKTLQLFHHVLHEPKMELGGIIPKNASLTIFPDRPQLVEVRWTVWNRAQVCGSFLSNLSVRIFIQTYSYSFICLCRTLKICLVNH